MNSQYAASIPPLNLRHDKDNDTRLPQNDRKYIQSRYILFYQHILLNSLLLFVATVAISPKFRKQQSLPSPLSCRKLWCHRCHRTLPLQTKASAAMAFNNTWNQRICTLYEPLHSIICHFSRSLTHTHKYFHMWNFVLKKWVRISFRHFRFPILCVIYSGSNIVQHSGHYCWHNSIEHILSRKLIRCRQVTNKSLNSSALQKSGNIGRFWYTLKSKLITEMMLQILLLFYWHIILAPLTLVLQFSFFDANFHIYILLCNYQEAAEWAILAPKKIK